jgi:predicted negative regulator of RcsB-dependent stress response
VAYDLEEQEQLDALRAFWRRWGTAIMLGLLLIAVGVLGVRAWGMWHERQARAATVVFEQLQQAVRDKKRDRVQASSQILIQKYPRTIYASMGAMLAAHAALQAGDAKAAKAPLEWAAKSSKDAEYLWLARLQLAGVLLDEGAYAEGLKWLSGSVPQAWGASFADRQGDLWMAQGQRDAARKAYREALDHLKTGGALRDAVQLKLDALGDA